MKPANIDEQIEEARRQEEQLQFREFTPETALEIGLMLIGRAKAEGQTIAIDVRVNGHQWFHYSSAGASPDNDEWLTYKTNTVNRFHVSSYLFGLRLRKSNRTVEDMGFRQTDYAPWGGGFPVTIKNVGVVGSIAVSGVQGNGDHDWLVEAIEKVISKQAAN